MVQKEFDKDVCISNDINKPVSHISWYEAMACVFG